LATILSPLSGTEAEQRTFISDKLMDIIETVKTAMPSEDQALLDTIE
jgi:hypothetical protein